MSEPKYHTSGLIRLTRPQLLGTMAGLLLSVLLASLDQTIVGTAEPRIIASLSGFNRYPWVATAYLLSSTIAVPIFAKLSDMYGRKWFFLGSAGGFVLASALCGASGKLALFGLDGMNQLIVFRDDSGRLRRRHDGSGVYYHRRRFFPSRERQVPGFLCCHVRLSFHLRTHAGRLAHGPGFLARDVLREPAGRHYCHRRDVSLFPLLASRGRPPADRLGGRLLFDFLHGSAAAGAHLGHRLWMVLAARGLHCSRCLR